jgi:hypothetical protein
MKPIVRRLSPRPVRRRRLENDPVEFGVVGDIAQIADQERAEAPVAMSGDHNPDFADMAARCRVAG